MTYTITDIRNDITELNDGDAYIDQVVGEIGDELKPGSFDKFDDLKNMRTGEKVPEIWLNEAHNDASDYEQLAADFAK